MDQGGSASPEHNSNDGDEEVVVLEEDFADDVSGPTDVAQTAGTDSNSEPEVFDVVASEEAEDEVKQPEIEVKFTCPFCPEEMGEKERWVDHVAKSHSARAPTVCYICVRSFSTALGMNLHFSKEHPGESMRKEFVADSIGNEEKVAQDSGNEKTVKVSAMASFYSNLDAAIPKKGASRTIVVRRPATKNGSGSEDEMERPTRKFKPSYHRSQDPGAREYKGNFKPRKPYTRRDGRNVTDAIDGPVKITGRHVVGAEYDEIQSLINELEPIPSQNRVGSVSKMTTPMTRMNRKRLSSKMPSANLSCPSCGMNCSNLGSLQVHMFERHNLLWCRRCKLKANESEMTEHLTQKHGINKAASYSFLVEWNSRGAVDDEEEDDTGSVISMNVRRTSSMEAFDTASDNDEIICLDDD